MFNAIDYSKGLEDAGFSRQQAEAMLNTLYGFTQHNLASKSDMAQLILATKSDFAEFKSSIKEEMAEFKSSMKEEMAEFKSSMKDEMAEFKSSIKEEMTSFKTAVQKDILDLKNAAIVLEHRMTIKMGSMLIVAVGLIVTLQKVL